MAHWQHSCLSWVMGGGVVGIIAKRIRRRIMRYFYEVLQEASLSRRGSLVESMKMLV